jgi:hypothetical protein
MIQLTLDQDGVSPPAQTNGPPASQPERDLISREQPESCLYLEQKKAGLLVEAAHVLNEKMLDALNGNLNAGMPATDGQGKKGRTIGFGRDEPTAVPRRAIGPPCGMPFLAVAVEQGRRFSDFGHPVVAPTRLALLESLAQFAESTRPKTSSTNGLKQSADRRRKT